MQLNIIFSRKKLIEFLNIYMYENDLIFFDETHRTSEQCPKKQIEESQYREGNLKINVGSLVDFEKIKNKTTLSKQDKVDFIYIVQLFFSEKENIECLFIWEGNKSLTAKKFGNKLSKEIKRKFTKGMLLTTITGEVQEMPNIYWNPNYFEEGKNIYDWTGKVLLTPINNTIASSSASLSSK